MASVRDGKEGKKIEKIEKIEKVEEKEVGVKIEEGSEGAKGPSAERAGKFFIGAEVAYKDEGGWEPVDSVYHSRD